MMLLRSVIMVSTLLFMQSIAAAAQLERLDLLIDEALSSDPRIKLSDYGVAIGEARTDQAFADFLPQVNFNSEWTDASRSYDTGFASDYKGERMLLTVNQVLFDKKVYDNWQRAGLFEQQSALQQQQAISDVMLDTIERYFSMLESQDKLALVEDEKNSIDKKMAQIKKLYDTHRVKVTDVYRIEAQYDSVLADEIAAVNQQELARQSLSEIVGRTPGEVASLNDVFVLNELDLKVDDWIDQAVQSNPLLAQRRLGIETAKEAYDVEFGGHLPVVGLRFTREDTDVNNDGTPIPQNQTDTYALTVSVPLYSGGKTSAKINEAAEQINSAHAEYDKELRAITKQVQESYLNNLSQSRRLKALAKAVESAAAARQAISRGYDLGVETLIALIDADQELRQLQVDYLSVKYQILVSEARLKSLTGQMNKDFINHIQSGFQVFSSEN